MPSNQAPDYYQVDVPQQKAPEDYHYTERRAEILQLILDRGTPHGINQNRLAERYDVSPSQISQDMDRLRSHVDQHLGRQAKMTTRAAYQQTVQKLQEDGEWKKAWDVVMEWNRWLQDIGKQEKEPDKHEISGELNSQHTEKKMMVGVDLAAFPEVDTSRMVGVDLRDEMEEPPDGVEIDLEDAPSPAPNPGGHADDSEGSE